MKAYKASCIKSRFQPLYKSKYGVYVIRYDVEEYMEGDDVFVRYSELPMKINPTYPRIVSALIREKYDEDAEFAVNRQRDEKPEEFQEYNEYCENCKVIAKQILNIE